LNNYPDGEDFNKDLMPSDRTIDQLITEQVNKFPDNIAIKFGDKTLSYQYLSEKVNQLANLLITREIKPGDKICLAVDRSIEMVIALLAIMRAGAAYVPLDPNFPIDRLNFMLDDSEAKLLLTSKKYDQYLQSGILKLFIEDTWPQLADHSADEPDVTISSNDLAYVLYTSGSTGKPKGVQIEHHSLTNLLLSIQKKPGLNRNDILLAVATISFDIAGLELFLPLITGAKLIIADSDMAKDGRLLLNTIRAEKVTVMQATPYTWRMMLASGWDEKIPLKVFCGGEAMPKDMADKLIPKCSELWNLYGPTETTIYSTGKQITADDKIITIGTPIDNTQIYILNNELKPVPNGEEGEIFIGGDGVARGYLNRPELSAEKFIPDPFTEKPARKMYRSGDLGRITPDGEIQYLGRIDHQVKIRGYRIETEGIEYKLIHQPNVQNAVVVVHEDHLGNQRLIAYVVAEIAIQPNDAKHYFKQWIKGLKTTLPDYMVPVDYILIPELPLTPNGKTDRKLLPKPELHTSYTAYAPPESDTEKMLANIWSKYLGIEKLGIYDNFFELGGHSLIAVQIMTSIGKITGKLIPIATLFKYPTVQKLALLLQLGQEDTTWKSLVPIKPTGNKMPVYIVHGVGLNVLVFNNIAQNVDIEQPVYGLQSRGLNGIDEVPDSIPGIAALYVGEILEQNPTGPYAIAGYSLGGYIAIEMAIQLQKMGKEVKMLAMLDANLKYFNSQLPLSKQLLTIGYRQLRKSVFVINSFIKQPGKTISYLGYMIKTRLLQPFGLFAEEKPEDVPAYMQKIVDKLQHAVSQYKTTPYNGTIDLFMSMVRDYYVDDPKQLGWGKLALKGVQVHMVPGNHLDMLLSPNDILFAEIFQDRLDKATAV
jgi:amino acid adenylation domain-containing protein